MIGTIVEDEDADSQVYEIRGFKGTASDGVSQAKKEYADEHDVDYHKLTGRKLHRGRDALQVVVVKRY